MKRWYLLPLLLVFVLACSISTAPQVVVVTATPAQPQVIVVTATPLSATATPYPTYTPFPTPTVVPNTPTPYPTYTPYPSPQGNTASPAGAPTVSVSVDTQCRIGPGKEYIQLSGLVVGKTTKVVGKSADGLYWIVKNPTDIGNCWLWGEYATVTGDTSNLKVYEEPTWLKNFTFQLVVITSPDLANPGKCFYDARLIGFPRNFTFAHAVRQRIQGDWQELYSAKKFNTGDNDVFDVFSTGSIKIKGDLLVTTIQADLNGGTTLLATSVDEPNCK